MFDRILVPLDGSAAAEKIIPFVEALSDKFISEVVLLQVLNPFRLNYMGMQETMLDEFAAGQEWLEVEASTYLRIQTESLRAKGIRARALLVNGPTATSIAEFADQERLSLIAMASPRRSWLSRLLYGNIPDLVKSKTSVPILLVKVEK